MKKIIITILVFFSILFITLFSGCGIYEDMDLETVSQKIATLETTSLDLENIKEVLENDSLEFGELEDINMDIFSKEFFMNEVGYLFRQEKSDINSVSLTSYIIVKPEEDKKELLKEQIELYYKSLLEEYNKKENATEEIKNHLQTIMKKEYEGYLIYILSYNNDAVWKKIEENSHSLLLPNIKEATLDDFGLKKEDVKEFKAMIPSAENNISFYAIIKPKYGKADEVKRTMNQYFKTLDKKWNNYLPDQYYLLQNYMDTEIGSYLIYIVSKDNQLILNTMKDAVVKKD